MTSYFTDTGRSALYLYLSQFRGSTKKKYVVVPALTCIGVIQAIRSAGFQPLYINIGDDLAYVESELVDLDLTEVFAVLYQAIYGGIKFNEDLNLRLKSKGVLIIADMAQSYCVPTKFLKEFDFIDFVFLSFQMNKPVKFGVGGQGISRRNFELKCRTSYLLIFRYFVLKLLYSLQDGTKLGRIIYTFIKNRFDPDKSSGEYSIVSPSLMPRFLIIMLRDRIDKYTSELKEKQAMANQMFSTLREHNKWCYIDKGLSYYSSHYIPILMDEKINDRALYDWPVSHVSPYKGQIENYDYQKFGQIRQLCEDLFSFKDSKVSFNKFFNKNKDSIY